jgi:uncharacterized phage protein (TIGR02218 family)
MRTTADLYTRVYCVRVIPRYDTHTVNIAQYPVDLIMSNSTTYAPADGIEFSDYEMGVGFATTTFEIKGAFGDRAFTREQLLRGEYDGAKMYMFATSWANPVEDEEPLGTFIFGKSDVGDDVFTIEAVAILDSFNCEPKITYQQGCNNTLFDVTPDGKSVPFSCCGLAYGDYVVESSATAVNWADNQFSDSGRTEDADWFALGYVRFKYTNVVGDDVYGAPYEIIAFDDATGTFTLLEAPLYDVSAGTAYLAVPGCDKSVTQCINKFNNLINGGGDGGGFFGFNNPPTDRTG